MRVLVATSETQGDAEGDYCWTIEGELVHLPLIECCEPQQCGCGRGFCGFSSHRASTTAKVIELDDMDRTTFRQALYDTWDAGGWVIEDDPDLDEVLDEHLRLLDMAATHFEVGDVVGRTDTWLWKRAGKKDQRFVR